MTRIVHVSTSDLLGGADRYAYSIHRALVDAGHDSRLLVGRKLSDDPTVLEIFPQRWSTLRRRLRERLDELPLWSYRRRRRELFSINWAPNRTWRAVVAQQPQVVHLHWVNQGLLPLRHFARLGAKLVWTLSDQWPFTGGCHYSGGCRRFEQACGACPLLASSARRDLSARVLAAKQRQWAGLQFELVAPSEWLAAEARRSALFAHQRCTTISLAVDTRVFRPIPRAEARQLLGLPEDSFITALGATRLDDRRKGFDLAANAIAQTELPAVSRPMLCTFGSRPPSLPAAIGSMPIHHLGPLQDPLMVALVFSAADVALIPSREDAGPLTAVEALACGTPVVGFPVGVIADLVQHERNGFLASRNDVAGLAAGLRWAERVRTDPHIREQARAAVVAKASLQRQIHRYVEIYERIVSRPPTPAATP